MAKEAADAVAAYADRARGSRARRCRSASAAGSRAPGTWSRTGGCFAMGSTPSAALTGSAGTLSLLSSGTGHAGQDEHGMGWVPASMSTSSTPTSSASLPAKRCGWTRSSGCCWRWPGKPSSTPGWRPSGWPARRTGVFIGISSNDYAGFSRPATLHAIDAYAVTGNALSIAANRLSYVFDLRGPSLAVDTACSSSLVAVHLACQSLRAGECDLALAGGVNLILSPELTIALSQARMLAADGRCKTFDAAADGYVRGEGCGVVVLKRLVGRACATATASSRVIRGTAVNQDGRSNGLTAPNGPSQQAVIRQALAAGGRRRRTSQLRRGARHRHGAGRPDRGSMRCGRAWRRAPAGQPLLVGSVKTNIGHLEAAAGIASLIKVVLALQHGEIPPHLHFTTLNPHIDLGGTAIRDPEAAAHLGCPARGRRKAGVSSFGFGGTNAHVIVEEAPPPRPGRNGPTAGSRADPLGKHADRP